MGRRIPGRKHRGVRDIEQQILQRKLELRGVINDPPANPDDQPLPKSLKHLIEWKKQAKTSINVNKNKVRKKLKKKKITELPSFKRKPNETDLQYEYRTSRWCENFRKEAHFQIKYNVVIQRNADGKIENVVKRPKDAVEKMLHDVRENRKHKHSKTKQNPKKLIDSSSNSKTHINVNNNSTADIKDFDQFQDVIRFGERVDAPPKLTVRPRKSAPVKNMKQKDLLLATNKINTSSTVIDRRGKRKRLPTVMRMRLEQEQADAIATYRSIKSKLGNTEIS